MQEKKCKKVGFESQEAADKRVAEISQIKGENIKPIRAYLCACGKWHLTSRQDIKDIVKELERLKEENKSLQEQLGEDPGRETIKKLRAQISILQKYIKVLKN